MIKYAIAAIFAFGLIILVLVAGMPKAKAEDWPYTEFSETVAGVRATKEQRRRYKRPRVYKRHKRRHPHGTHPAAVVKAWRKLDGFSDGHHCIAAVTTVGDQANSTEGAKSQADKAWTQLVRYKAGERYMDLRFAKSKTYTCVHSSVPNVVNRATAVVGLDTQFERCEIIATPCIPAKGD